MKSEATSAVLVLHRARDFLVRQVTQTGNAIRAHMAEFGIVAVKGMRGIEGLASQLDALPDAARLPLQVLLEQISQTKARIDRLTEEIEEAHRHSEASRRLTSIPGVGVLTATAITATTPDVSNFASARDYAAWLGLTPKQHSRRQATKRPDLQDGQPLHPTPALSRRHGAEIEQDLGAMAQIMVRRRRGRQDPDWLSHKLETKETKLVAIALANRMVRTIFALLRDGTSYRPRVRATTPA